MTHRLLAALLLALFVAPIAFAENPPLPSASGFHGIWYHIGPAGDYKYSGGFATYPQQIRPFAIYAPKVNKTFFVYGGTNEKGSTLLHMVSYFDHATGMVARPRILLDKKTTDAHDNPCLAIDDAGFIYIFSNTHGPENRSSIHKSVEPYNIDRFETVFKGSFSYGQSWFIPGQGFLFIHNRYQDGRAIAFMTSTDGTSWSKPSLIAHMPVGHYQISATHNSTLGLAFNYHPHGLDTRTNLYYLQTRDFGKTWQTADGQTPKLPLTNPHNPALVLDAEAQHLLVYLKDIQFDDAGNPILLFLTSKGFEAGPKNDPRTWITARWTGKEWTLHPVTTSDYNYDFGQLYLEPNNTWRILAPTDPGPEPYMTGGEIVEWISHDQGLTWTRGRSVTNHSPRNQTFVREPINAQDDFYAFWADGDASKPSVSYLYFTNKSADKVWRLPPSMTTDTAKPELVTDSNK
jgi:hypothetical protein